MKIVIDIPEGIWSKAKEYGHLDICGVELSKRVINGTPLPKGHGRLIDADVLIGEMPIDICDGYEAIDVIERTPTIIEGSDSE